MRQQNNGRRRQNRGSNRRNFGNGNLTDLEVWGDVDVKGSITGSSSGVSSLGLKPLVSIVIVASYQCLIMYLI